MSEITFDSQTIQTFKDLLLLDKEVVGMLRVKSKNSKGIILTNLATISGEEGDAPILDCKYSYHTHPKLMYLKRNVSLAWPSLEDYLSMLELPFNSIHFVISLEGIYSIKFRKDKISKNTHLLEEMIEKEYHYPYPREESNYTHIRDYLKIINNKPVTLFNVSFVGWNQIHLKPF